MSKPTFQTCCNEVADKLGITTAEMHPSTYQVVTQAAQLYADRCVEEAMKLLERASWLVGNPGTNISSGTDLACESWQKDYEEFINPKTQQP